MRAIRNAAGLVAVAGIAALLLIAAQSPAGSAILAPAGASVTATGRALRDNIPGLGLAGRVAGNPVAFLLVLLGVFVVTVVAVPGAREGRGMVAAFTVAAALALVMYQPSLIGGGA